MKNETVDFSTLSPTVYADICGRKQVLHAGIKELWQQIPRIAGPAFTVQLSPGDNLMMHAAIYDAPPGSIIAASGCGNDFAVAGGNLCAIAQERGIRGFIIDGVVRDIAEIRRSRFSVFARGVVPVPGIKRVYHSLCSTILCGGVRIQNGDIIVADEEGIIVLPSKESLIIFENARIKSERDESISLSEWSKDHRKKIESILNG